MARAYLKGLPQFKARLAKIAKAAEDQTKKTLTNIAVMVVAAIQARVPWQHLKDAVDWTFGIPPKYAQVIAKAGLNGIVVTIFVGNTKTRDAAWAEYGTKPHEQGGIFKGKGIMHPGTVARPFFWPGWRATRNAARKMLREEIKGAVRRAKQ